MPQNGMPPIACAYMPSYCRIWCMGLNWRRRRIPA